MQHRDLGADGPRGRSDLEADPSSADHGHPARIGERAPQAFGVLDPPQVEHPAKRTAWDGESPRARPGRQHERPVRQPLAAVEDHLVGAAVDGDRRRPDEQLDAVARVPRRFVDEQ
ncbi:hypothetical protein GALL_495070 [mine drainage metagenome]|uniref:Uncharacterized protein n=1 Tax=mine drainage metagenome TaxID=410659 RepID=A0A1J5PDP9_9ZZZZ